MVVGILRKWLRSWLGIDTDACRIDRVEQSITGLDRAVAALYIEPEKPTQENKVGTAGTYTGSDGKQHPIINL